MTPTFIREGGGDSVNIYMTLCISCIWHIFQFRNFTSIAQGYHFARDSNGSPLPIEVALTEYASDKLDIAKKSYVFNAQTNTSKMTESEERGSSNVL